jgi:hypothetical protein
MWWALAVVAVILVAAVVVDRRRGRPRRLGSGDDRLRDAAYGEAAATAQSIRRPDGNGGGAAS